MLRSSALLAVPALLPLVIGGSCGGGGGGPEGPNVLLITVDTLRADRLGCYGYGRDTSPALDRFAEEGVLFERAYAHAPFTAPSHASLFTSLYTDGHGVKNWGYRLDPQAVSFAERFAAGGWRTGAFYNHPTLRSCDLERGFQTVRRRYFEMAEDSIGDLLEWIDSPTEPTKKGAPFAAWLHLWDVHRPYAYRDWGHELLRDKVAREVMQFTYEETRFGTNDDVAVGRTEQFYNLSSTRRERLAGEQGLDGDDWAFIGDRYDGGVWYADRALGRLFDELRSRGVLDDTLVIVTSDHGEALTEREACWFTHDPFLHEETLHVPLIVRFPGGEHAGRRVDRLVRGVDVLPTMLQVADLPATGTMWGRSLLDVVEGRDQRDVFLFAQTQTRHGKETPVSVPTGQDGWVEHRQAVFDGRFRLIHDLGTDRTELFDVQADPRAVRNLAAEEEYAPELRRLQKQLEAFRRLPAAGESAEDLSPEDIDGLRATGYIGADEEGC